MRIVETDYLVIGSGMAGLSAARELAPHGKVLVVTKRDMHDTTLVRSHGAKLHAAMLLGSLRGSITSDGLELLSLTILVTLNIDDNGITKAHSANGNGRHQELQRIKGLTMTADEDSQVITGDIEMIILFSRHL